MAAPRERAPGPWTRMLLVAAVAAGCCGVPRIAAARTPAPVARRIDLVQDIAAAEDLAAPANGQTLYILDAATGGIAAVDPFEPGNRWTAVTAPQQAGAATPVSIACIDTTMLAVLGRDRDGWAVRTFRLQPGSAVDPDKPAQKVVAAAAEKAGAAEAGAAAGRPAIAVSPSRDWLAVCGLPAPLPGVLRSPIAGARLGGLSAKGCPAPPAAGRPVAAAISVAEELVLFSPGAAAGRAADVFVSFMVPPDPRRLLHLDTGLSRVADAAFCRSDGTLWAVGEGREDGRPVEGLWRIDAVLREGRQAARATCIARLEAARSVVCLSERAVIVTHGRAPCVVSRIDPAQQGGQP